MQNQYPLNDTVYRAISVLSPVVLILAWELSVYANLLDSRYFPPPVKIFAVLIQLVRTGELFDHLSISLQRIFLGFFLGSVPGIVLGMLMGWKRGLRAIFDPIVNACFPIPKITLLPFFLIIFGLGETSKIFTIAIGVFFLMVIITMHGVMRIDPVLVHAGQNLGTTGWKLFTKIILPASLPTIFTGLRLSLNVSLLIIVATEFVASEQGIGYFIWLSWSTLAIPKMYAGLVVIAVLGIIFTYGLNRMGYFLMPWSQDLPMAY